MSRRTASARSESYTCPAYVPLDLLLSGRQKQRQDLLLSAKTNRFVNSFLCIPIKLALFILNFAKANVLVQNIACSSFPQDVDFEL